MADPTLLVPGVADGKNMEALWNKGNAAIRTVDPTTIVMFEGSTYDILSGFNNVPGGDGSKTAHSYHYYNPPQLGSIETTITNRIKDNVRLKTTGMLTEFEIWDSSPAGVAKSLEIAVQADRYLQSWAAWAYEELLNWTTGEPSPALSLIYARTYAEATAGITKTSYFEDYTGKYWVSWAANTGITAPGLIRISQKAYYPDGIRVISNPPNAITHTMENDNVVQLHYTNAAVNGQVILSSVQPFYPTGAIRNSASGGKCIDIFEGTLNPVSSPSLSFVLALALPLMFNQKYIYHKP
jgi:endoglycosylceramidase